MRKASLLFFVGTTADSKKTLTDASHGELVCCKESLLIEGKAICSFELLLAGFLSSTSLSTLASFVPVSSSCFSSRRRKNVSRQNDSFDFLFYSRACSRNLLQLSTLYSLCCLAMEEGDAPFVGCLTVVALEFLSLWLV